VEELIHEVRSKSDATPVPALNELPCGKEQRVAFRIGPEVLSLVQFPILSVGWLSTPFESLLERFYKLISNNILVKAMLVQLRPDQ
jgi:hypothetical protein